MTTTLAAIGITEPLLGPLLQTVTGEAPAETIEGCVLRHYTDPSGVRIHTAQTGDEVLLTATVVSDRTSTVIPQALIGDRSVWALEVGADEPYAIAVRVEPTLRIEVGVEVEVALVALADHLSCWPDERSYLASGGDRSVMAVQSLVPHGLDAQDAQGPRPEALVTGVVLDVEDRVNALTQQPFRLLTLQTWGLILSVAVSAETGAGVAPGCIVQADCLLIADRPAPVVSSIASSWGQLPILAEMVIDHRHVAGHLFLIARGDDGQILLERHGADGSRHRVALTHEPSLWDATASWITLAFSDHFEVLGPDLAAVHAGTSGSARVAGLAAGDECVWIERWRAEPGAGFEVEVEQIWPSDGGRRTVQLGRSVPAPDDVPAPTTVVRSGTGLDAAHSIHPVADDGVVRQGVLTTDGLGGVDREELDGPPWVIQRRLLPSVPGDHVTCDLIRGGLVLDGSLVVELPAERAIHTLEPVGAALLVTWLDGAVEGLLVDHRLRRRLSSPRQQRLAVRDSGEVRWACASSRTVDAPSHLLRLLEHGIDHIAVLPGTVELVAAWPDRLVFSEPVTRPDPGAAGSAATAPDRRLRVLALRSREEG